MGLEWHNRKRSTDGRFARQERKFAFHTGVHHSQLHLRLPAELAERVRRMALDLQMEINEFCCRALEEQCSAWEEVKNRCKQQEST